MLYPDPDELDLDDTNIDDPLDEEIPWDDWDEWNDEDWEEDDEEEY